jgi:hypothetical protein
MVYIAASGSLSMSGKAAVVVRAQAYPDPALDCNAAPYKEPPASAAYTIPLASGAWSFGTGNLVPGATCDALSGAQGQGGNNSTLVVWYAFLGLDHWVVECTRFHGYCPPGSGASGASGASGMSSGSGSFAAPPALHATFHGHLSPLGTVPLTRTGSSWAGVSPALGGALLAFHSAGHTYTLLSAGPGVTFVVSGVVTASTPFVWSCAGEATGHGAGAFSVTVLE